MSCSTVGRHSSQTERIEEVRRLLEDADWEKISKNIPNFFILPKISPSGFELKKNGKWTFSAIRWSNGDIYIGWTYEKKFHGLGCFLSVKDKWRHVGQFKEHKAI